MSYIHFLSSYWRLLSFGLLTALCSSFGQTFFISLFLPYFLADFALDKGDFGLLYGGATLLGALCLPYLGSRIDELDLPRYTAYTIAGLSAAAFLIAFAPHVLLLGAGLAGLRLTGQGLLGHISHTVMAREFAACRGRALGFAGLGYPLGEAVLPVASAMALRFLPWTWIWAAVGAGALAIVLPLALHLLRHPPASADGTKESSGGKELGGADSIRPPWKDARLYQALPPVLAPGFVLTGLFLFQIPLSEAKGWAPEWMAAAFTGFALSRALSSLAVGPLIDRFSALRLLPLYLLPLGLGVVALQFGSSPWIAFVYLALAGMTAGMNGSIASAVWAEMFGVVKIGKVRSAAAALGVLGAAGSPALMGWLFREGVTWEQMLLWTLVLVLVCSFSAVGFLLNPGRTPVAREGARKVFGLILRPRSLLRTGGE